MLNYLKLHRLGQKEARITSSTRRVLFVSVSISSLLKSFRSCRTPNTWPFFKYEPDMPICNKKYLRWLPTFVRSTDLFCSFHVAHLKHTNANFEQIIWKRDLFIRLQSAGVHSLGLTTFSARATSRRKWHVVMSSSAHLWLRYNESGSTKLDEKSNKSSWVSVSLYCSKASFATQMGLEPYPWDMSNDDFLRADGNLKREQCTSLQCIHALSPYIARSCRSRSFCD